MQCIIKSTTRQKGENIENRRKANAKPEVQNLPEAESFQCVKQQQKQEAKLTAISTPNPNPCSTRLSHKILPKPISSFARNLNF